MKKIHFSRHACRRMRWRRVSEEEVLEVLGCPSELGESVSGRKNASKVVGQRILKVTYREDGDEMIVVTVIWKDGP